MNRDARQIWVVDDDESIRFVLERALTRHGLKVRCFADGEHVLAAGRDGWPDLVITDLRMPGVGGMDLMDRLHERAPQLPVIVMTAYSDLDTTVSAYHHGAYEYLPKPFDIDEVLVSVERAMESGARQDNGPQPLTGDLIGDSPAMQQVFRQIGRLSRSHLSVLITGETGTGKELIASALHRLGPRASGPFIALNTAAVPPDLLESELFGHEKGAFTGATARHLGRFEQADGGTLFLDEIGDMPAHLQTRLLRVLAEGQFYRVGGRSLIEVDVRVVAATHQDLAERVAAGNFRQDLFHRLNVVHIEVPALRERGSDILMLAEHFLERAARDSGLERKQLEERAASLLERYAWPGNVRELENLCASLTVMEPGLVIRASDLASRLGADSAEATPQRGWERGFTDWFERQLAAGDEPMNRASRRLQRLMIEAALARTGGRREAAARLLGCGRNTLTRKIASLDIQVPESR